MVVDVAICAALAAALVVSALHARAYRKPAQPTELLPVSLAARSSSSPTPPVSRPASHATTSRKPSRSTRREGATGSLNGAADKRRD